MHMRHENIAATAHHLQKHNGIKNNNYPIYAIHQLESDTIELCGQDGEWFSITTNYLSDIHAILALCHPNKQYCMQHDSNIDDHYLNIDVYSHGTQPNILTYQRPTSKYNGRWVINTQHINDIPISDDEPLHHAIIRANNHTKAHLPFIDQHPYVQFGGPKLHTKHPIPQYPNIHAHVKTQMHDHTHINIQFSVSQHPRLVSIPDIHIPIDQLFDLPRIYLLHINTIIPQLAQNIQRGFPHSQHEKIHITRAIVAYFTTQHHHMLQNIQQCAEILRDHYIYIPQHPAA